MSEIISHLHPFYKNKWKHMSGNKYNGAYYYSKEIVERIIPNIRTDRNWVTINIKNCALNHSIIFIHNNLNPDRYDWLQKYDDLILICGIPETVEKVQHLGKSIYLPLSIDVEEVSKFKLEKSAEVAFAGRKSKKTSNIPDDVPCLENLPRNMLLAEMARYKKIYAVGRTALEALCLDCEILPYDDRFPDVSRWQVLDNLEAAQILQNQLDEIDGIK